jgi:hypothetical protein
MAKVIYDLDFLNKDCSKSSEVKELLGILVFLENLKKYN